MRLLFTLALALFVTTGCNLVYKQSIQQGNAIEQEDLDKLRIGMTKNQVSFLLGTPAIRDPFHQDRWDYVSTFSRRGDDAVMRKVTLYFENGTLSEMIGAQGDEFIFEEDEEPAEEAPPADDEPLVEDVVAASVAEEAPFESDAMPEPEAAPMAAASAAPEEAGAVEHEAVEAPAEPNLAAAPDVAPETPATSGDGWVIQLGAFDSAENARGVLERLESAGIDAVITETPSAAGTRYLVRKYGIETREEAERLLEDIGSGLGINGFLVAPED